jgi:hypothetical protein
MPTSEPTPTATALHEEATAAAVFEALADPAAALRLLRRRREKLADAVAELAAWDAKPRCAWCLAVRPRKYREGVYRCAFHTDGQWIAGKWFYYERGRMRPTQHDQRWRRAELLHREFLAEQVTKYGGEPTPCPYPERIPEDPCLPRFTAPTPPTSTTPPPEWTRPKLPAARDEVDLESVDPHPAVAPLLRATVAVHDAVRAFSGRPNECILASATLTDVLVALGYTAEMIRLEASCFGGPGRAGYWLGGPVVAQLGGFGDSRRRPAAGPGRWHGHVGVLVTAAPGSAAAPTPGAGMDGWPVLCDPTLDQAEGVVEAPVALRVPPEWCTVGAAGRRLQVWVRFPGGGFAWVTAHPERRGWLKAPAFRPSYRRPLVAQVLAQLAATSGGTRRRGRRRPGTGRRWRGRSRS